jgi:hypothetical protein
MSSAKNLIQLIVDAFPDNTIPPLNPIREGIYDSVHDGVVETRDAFVGKKWREAATSIRNATGLMHAITNLSDSAFHYYFPAFLVAFTEQSTRAQSLLFDTFIEQLDVKKASEASQDLFLSLTSSQSIAIARFLSLLWEQEPRVEILLALENFWLTFLPLELQTKIELSREAEKIYTTFGWSREK